MSTIMVSALLIIAVIFSIRSLKNKGSCGDGCSGCKRERQRCAKGAHDLYKDYKRKIYKK